MALPRVKFISGPEACFSKKIPKLKGESSINRRRSCKQNRRLSEDTLILIYVRLKVRRSKMQIKHCSYTLTCGKRILTVEASTELEMTMIYLY